MKNSILMGTIVLTMALLPSFAAATSTPYDVLEGQDEPYEVPGTLLNPPTLTQTEGTAGITSANFDDVAMEWHLIVECFSSETDRCKGTINS